MLCCAYVGAQEGHGAPAPQRFRVRALDCRVVQAPPRRAPTQFRAVAFYGDVPGALQDELSHLSELHRRQASRGLEVAVVLPPEAAAKLAANAPHLVIATADRDLSYYEGRVFVTAADGRSRLELSDPDGLIDAFEALVSEDTGHERMSAPFTQIFEFLWNLQTPNGGERLPKAGEVDQLLALLPRCGRARALDVLRHCWRSSESPEAARRAWRDGLGALADAPASMTTFCDLVLRGDRHDDLFAKQAAVAMAPVAAAAPDGPFTQLVYLRALLHAGQERVADQLAARLPALLGADPALNLSFAETLMEARQPERYEPAAAAAIARAEAAEGTSYWSYGAHHKLLTRRGRDGEAAALVQRLLRDRHPGAASDPWRMHQVIQDAVSYLHAHQTMGRFDSLGLALSEVAHGRFRRYDRVLAEALLLSGRVDAAIRVQERRLDRLGWDRARDAQARLRRYRAVERRLAEASARAR